VCLFVFAFMYVGTVMRPTSMKDFAFFMNENGLPIEEPPSDTRFVVVRIFIVIFFVPWK
jgi:hypothetical protein